MSPWGKRVRALRVRWDLTQVQFGELVGVNQTSVGDWERGTTAPSVPVQQRLAALEKRTRCPMAVPRPVKKTFTRRNGAGGPIAGIPQLFVAFSRGPRRETLGDGIVWADGVVAYRARGLAAEPMTTESAVSLEVFKAERRHMEIVVRAL